MEPTESISCSLRNFGARKLYERGGLWDERGSEAVEFALALSIWMAISFMVMYVSFALYAAHFVANAAEEAARYGSVRGSSWNSASCSANRLDCTASSTDLSDYVKS